VVAINAAAFFAVKGWWKKQPPQKSCQFSALRVHASFLLAENVLK
jgi:hypothetical protein